MATSTLDIQAYTARAFETPRKFTQFCENGGQPLGGIIGGDWFQIQGGDGFVAIPDLRDSRIVYTESQNGNTNRYDLKTGQSTSVRPRAALSEEQRKQAASGRGGRGVVRRRTASATGSGAREPAETRGE